MESPVTRPHHPPPRTPSPSIHLITFTTRLMAANKENDKRHRREYQNEILQIRFVNVCFAVSDTMFPVAEEPARTHRLPFRIYYSFMLSLSLGS